MASKDMERAHAEALVSCLGLDWTLKDIPEPPDFEVHSDGEVFGLEIRRVYQDMEGARGSSARMDEAENQKAANALCRLYYEKGGTPLAVDFLGPIRQVDREALVTQILRRSPVLPGAYLYFSFRGVRVFLKGRSEDTASARRWLPVDDRVGWVRSVTPDILQQAIDRKSDKLDSYFKKYFVIDLLLVAERMWNSGRLAAAENLVVRRNPGFRSIYFLSFPESAVRVGCQEDGRASGGGD